MLEHGSNNSLPATYRIALAISTAFLIHILLLSGIPSTVVQNPPAKHRQYLNLELVGAKSSSNTPTGQASNSNTKSANHNQPFKIAPASKSSPAPITKKKADQNSPTTPSRPSSSPSKSGSRTQVSGKESSEELTRITQSPTEQDPYLVKLAMHLATRLETLRIPAIKELAGSSTMELELQLLENGALTRARVITSTGIEQIDSAAYRAALSASPYPKPPDQGGKNRFEVQLVFAPSRL